LEHYPTLGMIVILLSIVGIFMIYRVSNMIKKRRAVS
jgi:competence protein ComGC